MPFMDIAEKDAFPISAVLVARPYDKKDSNPDANMRALHEAELIIAGPLGDSWSGFFELEAEDEQQNDFGFNVGVPAAVLVYNYNEAVNLQFNWGEMFFADPYGFLGDHFRMTRGHVATIDQKFEGFDGKIRSRRQNLTLTGRPIEQLFYSVGVSAQADSPKGADSTDVSEGKDASTIYARVAFDITPDIMVGGFIIDGEVSGRTCSADAAAADSVLDPVGPCTAAGDIVPERPNDTASDTTLEYQRIGLDAQADIADARVQFMYVSASDDAITGGENDNDAISLQAFYTMRSGMGMPTWVPLIRFDTYEKKNGTESIDEITLNLTRYFTQNAKAYIEYWDRSGEGSTKDDDRLTVQVIVAF